MVGCLNLGAPPTRDDLLRVGDVATTARRRLGFAHVSDLLAQGGHPGLQQPASTAQAGPSTRPGGPCWSSWPGPQYTQPGGSSSSTWAGPQPTQPGGPVWSSWPGPQYTQPGGPPWSTYADPQPTQPGGPTGQFSAPVPPGQTGGPSWPTWHVPGPAAQVSGKLTRNPVRFFPNPILITNVCT